MKNNLISALAMGLLALSSCSVQTELPVYMDESRDIDERVADALSRMTMEEKVAVFGFLRFPVESMQSVWPHLREFVEATRKFDGCISYDVAEDLFEPGLIRFSELWPTHELLDSHLNAPHIVPWRKATKELGLQERVFTAYDLSGSKSV